MKVSVLGFVTGLLLIASGGAHALLGWPPFHSALKNAGIDADVIGAIAAGWYFGSISMVAFGLIILHQAIRRLRGSAIQAGPLWTISAAYLLFGVGAYLARHFNPHFLLFIVTGVVVGLLALVSTPRQPMADAGPREAAS